MLLDKLTIAFSNPELAKELIERFEKNDLVGLDKNMLAIALGSPSMADKIMESSDIDENELAMCLASPELAKELLALRSNKCKGCDKCEKPKKKAKKESKDKKAVKVKSKAKKDDLSVFQKAAKKIKKIVAKN